MIPADVKQKIRELWGVDFFGAPLSVAELARGFKVSAKSIRKIISDNEASPDPNAATFTVEETARLLRVSPSKVRGWIRQGLLKAANVGSDKRPRFVVTRTALENTLTKLAPTPPTKTVKRSSVSSSSADRY